MPSEDVKCYSCGKVYPPRIVAVMNKGTRANPVWTAVDVCILCWHDPTHRKKPIKGHFFDKSQADVAVKAAGSSMIKG